MYENEKIAQLRRLQLMNIIKQEHNNGYYFAALKLIEQLYKDGKIPKYMFRNILYDYADVVDLSAFTEFEIKEESA